MAAGQAVCSTSRCFNLLPKPISHGVTPKPLLPTTHRACLHQQRGLPGRPLVSVQIKRTEVEPDPLALECPVPSEQQPMQELRELEQMFLFNWATMPLPDFALRIAGVFFGFFMTLGLPVSVLTFNISKEPVQCAVAASVGSMFIVTVLVLRLYLGWAYVGSRLLSATVEYEETGWYDGQLWVKTPQILMRDRLLGSYTVRPAMERLKRTLLGLGGALATAVVVLATVPPPQVDSATYTTQQVSYYKSGSGSSDAVSSSTAAVAGGDDLEAMPEYWQSVQKFEPWSLEGDGVRPEGVMRPHLLD